MEEVKALLRRIIENQNEMAGLKDVELSNKWLGGRITITPGDPTMKSTEISIDNLFSKIISVREKLRVLEQKINHHSKLGSNDKLELQQYISRCYGSLTTFNVLFRHQEDKFHGQTA